MLSKALDWPIDEARQLAGYAPSKIDWSEVTATELVYVLEKYPLLSDVSRRFVKEQIGVLVEFLLEAQEDRVSGPKRQMRTTPVEETASVKLEDLVKKRDSDKRNGRNNFRLEVKASDDFNYLNKVSSWLVYPMIGVIPVASIVGVSPVTPIQVYHL